MTDETTFEWTQEHEEVHHARRGLVTGTVLHMQVESLWEHGWDWHVWDSSGRRDPRYGLAASLDMAKARAEVALAGMLAELDLHRPMQQLDVN